MDTSPAAAAATSKPSGTPSPPLDSDHPKMRAFQAALKEVLLRRLRQEEEAVARAEREQRQRQKQKAAQQSALLEAQALLRREEERLAGVTAQLEEASRRRRGAGDRAAREEERLAQISARLSSATKRRDELRERLNRVREAQLAMEARRVAAAGEVAAGDAGATKAEKDFREAQEQKRLQDMYVDKLQKQAEEMEQRAIEYQEQVCFLFLNMIDSCFQKSHSHVPVQWWAFFFFNNISGRQKSNIFDAAFHFLSSSARHNHSSSCW